MTTPAEPNKPPAKAAAGPAKAAARPRVRLSPQGYYIDDPDQARGEQLMMEALGGADRDVMYGLLHQLVNASVSNHAVNPVDLAFMLSTATSIKPRDSIEALLVAQMVSVHVMTMRCVNHLADAGDLARQESITRALSRLARTFPAQIDALSRYRSKGEPVVTVQNVSVGDGGRAIVGNVTQHASVIVGGGSPVETGSKVQP